MAAISLQFPNSGLLQRIKIIQDADAKAFFNKWPSALKAREEASLSDGDVSMLFHETPTWHAVSAMSYRLQAPVPRRLIYQCLPYTVNRDISIA